MGKVWSPAKTRPYGKDSAYNRETGSRREGSRLAAEAVRAMTARTTQPRLSKGPLGERGRCLQERLGVVPLAAITRRGAVPVWLRPSWSCPGVAAKAASQPADCRRHEGWSGSRSPCTRWGTRSLRCARFQPDWGKPNVRLIGGREESGASRLSRAARGASRLPDYQSSPDPGPLAHAPRGSGRSRNAIQCHSTDVLQAVLVRALMLHRQPPQRRQRHAWRAARERALGRRADYPRGRSRGA